MCCILYTCWWGQWPELCFSMFKGMLPERPDILHLPLKLALFFFLLVVWLVPNPANFQSFQLTMSYSYRMALKPWSTPFMGCELHQPLSPLPVPSPWPLLGLWWQGLSARPLQASLHAHREVCAYTCRRITWLKVVLLIQLSSRKNSVPMHSFIW